MINVSKSLVFAGFLDFYKWLLIILDSEEFKSRVISAATPKGYNVHFDAVRYYEPSTDSANIILSLVGGMWKIAYWKRSKYSYQQECRFLISPGNGDDHITLEIGDISDITMVQPTKTILSSIVKKKTT